MPILSPADATLLLYKPEPDAQLVRQHQGRVRSFPHMEGSFATVVYIAGKLTIDLACAAVVTSGRMRAVNSCWGL